MRLSSYEAKPLKELPQLWGNKGANCSNFEANDDYLDDSFDSSPPIPSFGNGQGKFFYSIYVKSLTISESLTQLFLNVN